MNANAVIKNFKRPPLGSHVKLWLPVSTSIENAEMTQGVCQTLRRLIQLPELIPRTTMATGNGLLGRATGKITKTAEKPCAGSRYLAGGGRLKRLMSGALAVPEMRRGTVMEITVRAIP